MTSKDDRCYVPSGHSSTACKGCHLVCNDFKLLELPFSMKYLYNALATQYIGEAELNGERVKLVYVSNHN